MKVFLISWSAEQLESLRLMVQAEGYEVSQVIQRTHATPLLNLITNLNADVLIVECSADTQTQDIATLEILTATNPKVVVLMLSDTRSTDTLVAAMQAGVREVLPSPTTATDLTSALHRITLRQKSVSTKPSAHGKTITFMSCKGGSGATFLATNFADILAKDFGKKTAFLDLDLQCGDAAYYVSTGPNQSDITELTRQIDRLDVKLLTASMLHIGPNFDLLSAPEEPEASYTMSASQLERLLDLVTVTYDMVVLDVERVLDPLTIKALDMSDVIYLVMENLLPFVRDAKRLVGKFRALGYDDKKIRIVVNRYERNGTIDVEQIEKAVGLKVSHTIRSSFADVAQAINTGVPITEVNANNAIVQVLRDMARGYDGSHPQRGLSWIDRFMGTHT
jgi:pilus assembly protein CpaE